MRNKTIPIYWGIFLDSRTFLPHKLAKPISTPHVTFGFRTEVPTDILGTDALIKVIGYGCDANNEAYLVDVPTGWEKYFKNKVPHITISTSLKGKPKDSANLIFKPIVPFYITGRFGQFKSDGVVYYS